MRPSPTNPILFSFMLIIRSGVLVKGLKIYELNFTFDGKGAGIVHQNLGLRANLTQTKL